MAAERLDEYEGFLVGDEIEVLYDSDDGMLCAGETGKIESITNFTDCMFPGVKVYAVMEGADEPTEITDIDTIAAI